MRNSRSWALSTVSAAALFSLFAAAPATAQTSAPGGDACLGPADQRDPNANCAPTDSSAGQATAQRETAATEGEGVIVVGSRIPRPNFDTVQPSTVLSSQAIEQRGFVNAADALNELPQFGIPGSSPVGSAQGGAFGAANRSSTSSAWAASARWCSSTVGASSARTRRAYLGPTSAGEQVDLGLINTKLIDRIETIAIGGAPIYGSDAIAGTINVVLKSDYEGFDFDAQDGSRSGATPIIIDSAGSPARTSSTDGRTSPSRPNITKATD